MNHGAPLDGDQIRRLRIARCWTQRDLAERAGVSLRVVAKAEANQPLAVKTRAALARVLERHDGVVAPERASEASQAGGLMLTLLTAYRKDLAALPGVVDALLDSGSVFRIRGGLVVGDYTGPASFAGVWRRLAEVYRREGGDCDRPDRVSVVGASAVCWGAERYRSHGDGRLVVLDTLFHLTATGPRINELVLHLSPRGQDSLGPEVGSEQGDRPRLADGVQPSGDTPRGSCDLSSVPAPSNVHQTCVWEDPLSA